MLWQEAEEPRVLLLLLGGAAAAGVRAVRQGQVHAEVWGLRGAPPGGLHHRPGHGGKIIRFPLFST